MTITKTYAPDKYAGDGVQVDFPVTFDFLDSGNIKATVTDAADVDTALVAGVDYSVTGATLTTTVPVASGSRLTIWLDADYLQDTDWKNTGNYNLETLERAMDKAAVERQILKEAFSRTVTLPLTSEDTPENYLGQVRAARDAAVTARDGAEASKNAAAQSAVEAEASAIRAETAAEQADAVAVATAAVATHNADANAHGLGSTVWPVAQGGTGASTAAGARVALDVYSKGEADAINVNKVDRSEWTQSLGESGWQKLPSGLILQWGGILVPGLTGTSFNYPIAFPNTFSSLVGIIDNPSSTTLFVTGYSAAASTIQGGFRVNTGDTVYVRWFAIGY